MMCGFATHRGCLHFWVWLLFLTSASAQSPPQEPAPVRPTALKLPNGTVVFLTKKPDDVNPLIDGVMLSAAEYQTLLDNLDKLQKKKDNKTQAPSSCEILASIVQRGERTIAAMTITLRFRTIESPTVVTLGCQRAAILSAKTGTGDMPILNPPGEEGLTVLVDRIGEHEVILQAEVPLNTRGTQGEIGLDIGLPKAAVTTFAFEKPPPNPLKKFTLGSRISDGSSTALPSPEIKRVPMNSEIVLGKPTALGATDLLELTWEAPTVVAPVVRSAEADIQVKIEEEQIETVAVFRLRGPAAEWEFFLPNQANVIVERAPTTGRSPSLEPSIVGGSAEVKRPNSASPGMWKILTPADNTNPEWIVTVTALEPRPNATEATHRGPYFLRPLQAINATKQTAKITINAPVGSRVGFKPHPNLRRLDLPKDVAETTVAQFQLPLLPSLITNSPTPWLEFDVRPTPQQVRIRPQHTLTLTADGWRLDSTLRVTPPPRGEVDQLLIELPPGWRTLEARPAELIDEVQIVQDTDPLRTRVIRFATPQKAPFDFQFISLYPLETGRNDLSLLLPKYPQSSELNTKLSVVVPEDFEIRGTAFRADGVNTRLTADLRTTTPANELSNASVSGEFERGVYRVDLAWQPYRPDLRSDIRADITVQERQIVVLQTFRFKSAGQSNKPIRFLGPVSAVGMQSSPPLDFLRPGEWEFQPPNATDFTLTVSYAIRNGSIPESAATTKLPVNLLWPEQSTQTETVTRIWSNFPGKRLAQFTGPWRELPPEPNPERDTMPSYTLVSSGGQPTLTLELEPAPTPLAQQLIVERGLIEVNVGTEQSMAIQGRYRLFRWPSNGIEMEWPIGAIGEVLVDGKKVELELLGTELQLRYRVQLPQVKTNPQGLLLEIRYVYTPNLTRKRERSIQPPNILGAFYQQSVRWQIHTSGHLVPLFQNRSVSPDSEWVWDRFSWVPNAAVNPQELQEWFDNGMTQANNTSRTSSKMVSGWTFVGRESEPTPLAVILIPRNTWYLATSSMIFFLGFAISRLRPLFLGPTIAFFGILIAASHLLIPHILSQFLAGIQPGLATLVFALLMLALVKWYLRRRLEYLPAFSRQRTPSTDKGLPPLSSQHRSSRGPSAMVQLEGEPKIPSAPSNPERLGS